MSSDPRPPRACFGAKSPTVLNGGQACRTPWQAQPGISLSLNSVRPTARAPEDQAARNKERPENDDPGKIEAGERKCSRRCTGPRSSLTEVARGRRRSSMAIDDGVTTNCTPHQSESSGNNRHDQKCALQRFFSSRRADSNLMIRRVSIECGVPLPTNQRSWIGLPVRLKRKPFGRGAQSAKRRPPAPLGNDLLPVLTLSAASGTRVERSLDGWRGANAPNVLRSLPRCRLWSRQ